MKTRKNNTNNKNRSGKKYEKEEKGLGQDILLQSKDKLKRHNEQINKTEREKGEEPTSISLNFPSTVCHLNT